MTEPWLRGPIAELHPVAAHVLYTFTQCREEIATHTVGLTDVWKRPEPLNAVGFHLAHIAGSVNRLTTYLRGEQLAADQIARLKSESVAGPSLTELAAIDAEFMATEAVVRAIDPASYLEPRYVGRQQLPTTVGGLIVHIAEHTQRHLGQVVLTAKLVR
jgi:uncharacterized damage-inducible protein DinB